MNVTCWRHQKLDRRHQTGDSRHYTGDTRLETLDGRHQTIDSRQQTKDNRLKTVDTRQETLDRRKETLNRHKQEILDSHVGSEQICHVPVLDTCHTLDMWHPSIQLSLATTCYIYTLYKSRPLLLYLCTHSLHTNIQQFPESY